MCFSSTNTPILTEYTMMLLMCGLALGYGTGILCKIQVHSGAPGWLSQLSAPTFGFSSGHDLSVCGFESCVGLCAESTEPAWGTLSPSLSLPLGYIPQIGIEPLLCARHRAKCWQYRRIRGTVLDGRGCGRASRGRKQGLLSTTRQEIGPSFFKEMACGPNLGRWASIGQTEE